MAKQYVGPRRKVAALDVTGNNSGNWTVTFDPATMAIHWSMYEVYKIVVDVSASAGITHWLVFIGLHHYEGFEAENIATWSDPQPMRVDGGETVYFYFDTAAGDTPPVVTMWCQVDDTIARIQ